MASYAEEVKALAESLGSDGCSAPALQVYVTCCHVHDIGYALGVSPRGVPITKAQADQRFRDCLQAHSSLRWLSPLSWWRWVAVRQFGHGIWKVLPPEPRRGLFSHPINFDALGEAREARERIMGER